MTKDLFKKYLEGNCSEQEFEQFREWIEDDANKISSRMLIKEVWNEFEPEAGTANTNKYNRILDKVHHQINIKQNSNLLKNKRTVGMSRILPLINRAAAILLLPVLLLLVYTNLPDNYRFAENDLNGSNGLEVEAPAGSRTYLELGDGTKVWLNHGSKLRYPYRFKGKNRKVFLSGEAYFDVAQDKKAPFIVETNHIDVKATGTEFNVMAYSDDPLIETTLVEGKVILYDRKNNNRAIRSMNPNESLRYFIRNRSYTTDSLNIEKNVSWKDGLLIFKNDPIENIAKKISRWYNVEVIFTNNEVKKYTYTATFADETLPQVLELMELATPISYELASREKLPDGSYSKQKVLIGLK